MNIDGTEILRKNLLSDHARLLQQLIDLADMKADLDEEEYDETEKETLEHLAEVTDALEKMAAGNITLTDQLGSQRQQIREAISNAFRTPEVLQMFARRAPEQLRQRLAERERDFKLGKTAQEDFYRDKREILVALKQEGEILNREQAEFLAHDDVNKGSQFVHVCENSGDVAAKALQWAKQQ